MHYLNKLTLPCIFFKNVLFTACIYTDKAAYFMQNLHAKYLVVSIFFLLCFCESTFNQNKIVNSLKTVYFQFYKDVMSESLKTNLYLILKLPWLWDIYNSIWYSGSLWYIYQILSYTGMIKT